MAISTNTFNPDYAVPPGFVLEEELETLGLSPYKFAMQCGLPPDLIRGIISGVAPLERDVATEFARVLGGGPDIWLRMESAYRNKLAELSEDAELSEWAEKFPVEDLFFQGAVNEASMEADKVARMLSFFDVWSVGAFQDRYSTTPVTRRHLPGFESHRPVLASWLRLGQLEKERAKYPEYDRGDFLRALRDIRSLTADADNQIFPKAQHLCQKAGVALLAVEPLGGVFTSGASYWLPHPIDGMTRTPVIQISTRFTRDDHRWFSLFHEAAHILLHSKERVFIDGIPWDSVARDPEGSESDAEADAWAWDFLIPTSDWQEFVGNFRYREEEIRRFAQEQGIALGLVVGRLQREELPDWNRLSNLKQKLE